MKRLRRSRNKMFMGVCAGIAEYFNIDPTIIRIIWLVLAFASFGTFGVAYIICGIVIPEDDGIIYQDDENYNEQVDHKDNSHLFIGVGLILLGLFLLAKIIFPFTSLLLRRVLRFWPILLVLLGLYIIFSQRKEK